MESEKDQKRLALNPPSVKRVEYQRNFIKTAVCELRFPTLLELEAKPPRAFQTKIRKSYPFYEAQTMQALGGPADEGSLQHQYIFRSKDQRWTVSIKSFSIALETTKYVDFEDFFSRFMDVLKNAEEMIDSDFFTRVGLRYVNAIPISDEKLEGWIRPDLVGAITGGVLGIPESFGTIIEGRTQRGQYALRHGMLKGNDKQDGAPAYQLDFDYSKENVELGEIESLIRYFNETNFSFFSWCLGDKAQKFLGEGKPK